MSFGPAALPAEVRAALEADHGSHDVQRTLDELEGIHRRDYESGRPAVNLDVHTTDKSPRVQHHRTGVVPAPRRGKLRSLVDLLIQVIHRIGARAEKQVEKELLDDFKRVTGKIALLFHIAEASGEQPDGCVRDVVFPAACGEQKLRDLVREYRSSGPASRLQIHTHLRASTHRTTGAWCRNCQRS